MIRNMFYLSLLLIACNNEAKDSVEKADSANKVEKENADGFKVYRVDSESADFLVRAVNIGMVDMKSGEIARERAVDGRVRLMSEWMIKEHTVWYENIKKLATERNVSIPEAIGGDMQHQLESMGVKKGKDFDREYIRLMIRDREQAIGFFKKAFEKVNDVDIRTFANNSIPSCRSNSIHSKRLKN